MQDRGSFLPGNCRGLVLWVAHRLPDQCARLGTSHPNGREQSMSV